MPIRRCPIFLQGVKIPIVIAHKFLGILLDQELQWKDHINLSMQKGMKWVTQYCRLARPSKGISAKYMWCFYIAIAMPKMLYVADLFLIPE